MSGQELWRVEPDRTLSAEVGGFRLMVRAAEGGARFFVRGHLSETGAQSPILLAAGADADVRGAMSAAEREAARLASAHTPTRGPSASPALDAAGEIDVLLVDDDASIRACLTEMLSDGGLHVAAALSAAEALEMAETAGPAAVLVTDLQLGVGMDGAALIAALGERKPSMRAVLISGGEVPDGKLDPHDAFLHKPFHCVDLLCAVQVVRADAPRPALDENAMGS